MTHEIEKLKPGDQIYLDIGGFPTKHTIKSIHMSEEVGSVDLYYRLIPYQYLSAAQLEKRILTRERAMEAFDRAMRKKWMELFAPNAPKDSDLEPVK